jgi:hypothetical protein
MRNGVMTRNDEAKGAAPSRETEDHLVAILEREIRLQRDLEGLKKELGSFVSYSSLGAFHDIERYEGKIDTVNLDGFLRAMGHFASDIELLSIIRRMYADGDATVSFTEWSDFLRPIASLAPPLPPPVPAYIPRPYYHDPIYYPRRHYSPYYYDSPYYHDRYLTHYYSPYYLPSYRSRPYWY